MKKIIGFALLFLSIAGIVKSGTWDMVFNGTGTVTYSHTLGSLTAGHVFVNDTFTDTNGTMLYSHTGETGATWVNHSSFTNSGYSIKTNMAITTAAVAAAMTYASGIPPIANYDVDATFRVISTNYDAFGAGIAARVSTSPVNSMIFFRYVVTSGWQCFQTLAGTSNQIGSSSAAVLGTGLDYAVRLSVVGDTVTGSVGGTTICTGTTTVLSAGRVGLRGVSVTDSTGIGISNITATSR